MQDLLRSDPAEEFDKFHKEVDSLHDLWDNYQKLLLSFQRSEEEVKKKNEELKELNESKDKFFSIISHDLRSPFQGLLSISKYLADEFETLDKTDFRELLVSLNEALLNQYKFLDDLLNWSRIQSGRFVFSPNLLNLKQEAERVVELFETNLSSKKISLLLNIKKEQNIFADSDMLSLLLRNLISNAIKFTHTNGKIEVTAFEEDRKVIVVISDSGVGISQENINKLFRIDKQFTTSGTNKESGNGVGLILCKEIVEKHQGKIWVESILNKGTQFFFSIPFKIELS